MGVVEISPSTRPASLPLETAGDGAFELVSVLSRQPVAVPAKSADASRSAVSFVVFIFLSSGSYALRHIFTAIIVYHNRVRLVKENRYTVRGKILRERCLLPVIYFVQTGAASLVHSYEDNGIFVFFASEIHYIIKLGGGDKADIGFWI
jgi:hypothetical protein